MNILQYSRTVLCCRVLAPLFIAAGALAQQSSAPDLLFNTHNIELQTSLYPTIYRATAAVEDMRWVDVEAADLRTFWQLHGDSVLAVMSELAGMTWDVDFIEIHLVRYYPSLGNPWPMILPVGAMRVGALAEAVTPGAPTHLNLLYQLALFRLDRAARSSSDISFGLANHPLAQPGPYYRGLLAFHLALSTARIVMGVDTAMAAYQSQFWRRNLVGRELYEQYFLSRWQLSEEKPLISWLAKEPYDSPLVRAISPDLNQVSVGEHRETIESLASEGILGFSIRINDANQLVVDKIDGTRAGFKSGLRTGDIVNRVAGIKPKTHRELIELILNALEYGPVSVGISRAGKAQTILLRR